jgi:hypothetical protein
MQGLIAVALVVTLGTSCGSRTSSGTDVHARLAQLAHSESLANGEAAPEDASYVRTRRQAAMRAIGGGEVDTNQEVYLVKLMGSFVSSGPRPSETSSPTGDFLYVAVDAKSFRVTDVGITDVDVDLSLLGEPTSLSL